MKARYARHGAVAMLLWVAGGLATPASASEDALWQQLAFGGKVVLMRHAIVGSGRESGNSLERDPTCVRERNLSSAGEDQARRVGEAFRTHKIPVGEVRYSPYCRTADTARLAFGGGRPADYLSLREVLHAERAAAQTQELSAVIGEFAGPGNLVLVTHEPNINAVSFELIKHGDFLVLLPQGGGAFEELGVIRAGGD